MNGYLMGEIDEWFRQQNELMEAKKQAAVIREEAWDMGKILKQILFDARGRVDRRTGVAYVPITRSMLDRANAVMLQHKRREAIGLGE